MKQDRFLTGILIGMAVLVITAIALFFLRGSDLAYLEENTPGAVVLDYVLALQNGEYEKAYGYLAEEYQGETRPAFAQFRSYFSYEYNQVNNIGVTILSIDQEGKDAWVVVETVQSNGGLFGGVYRSQDTAILVMDDTGAWKLIRMPYQFWGWEWFGDVTIYR